MTQEAVRFLQNARLLLSHANIMLSVGLNDDAGRTAYLASFHTAQAFIFERIGKICKTHKGVQMEFFSLTKDDPQVPANLRFFLSQTYDLKSIADYDTSPCAGISLERATDAVETARQFVEHITALL
ncbi:MAG: HEPN domain-containing protein [Nitrospirae bacterium]|nr:HEPN domain-containing protein [Nitrospirota bacterium]